ncbi:hypothetical protein ANTQUA_LOCUS4522 [Anthophora quadrimaculata]
MPKENKSTSRRNRCQCPEVDNESSTSTRTSAKTTTIKSNRYSPFPRKDVRKDTTKENMSMSSMETLNTISGGIIENGIKYIMLPLHLLRFCIFGTSASASRAVPKERAETRRTKSCENKQEIENPEGRKTEKERGEERRTMIETSNNRSRSSKDVASSKSTSYFVEEIKDTSSGMESLKKVYKSIGEESTDEMMTAEEDSDSSGEQWSTARSTMIMNMSVDYTVLEEPMDISIDEQVIKISRDGRALETVQNNATGCVSSRLCTNKQDGNSSSVDEEIARIFQKQCTSSEDEFSPSSFRKSFSSSKHEKEKHNNFLYDRIKRNNSSVVTRSNKASQSGNEKERKKKTSIEFVANNKKRKVSHDDDGDEKQTERRNENKPREEKRSSRQGTPSKSKSRSSRTPVKNKESRRSVIKYKETATQTDSAFSDDDVEMIPVDTKLSERQFCCKHAARRLNLFHEKEMEQELNYVADNEDTNDGFLRIAHKRISSRSGSSSSADLGFDERVSATPDTDIIGKRSYTNSPNSASILRSCIRAPPGFPEVPQNPPLTSYIYNNTKRVTLLSSKENDPNISLVKTVAIVPPAPSPMPHLYYNYPEFMDLPVSVDSSKILNNILMNNYYR